MAAIDFPSSPSVGQVFTANNSTWQWDGVTWVAYNPTSGNLIFSAGTLDAGVVSTGTGGTTVTETLPNSLPSPYTATPASIISNGEAWVTSALAPDVQTFNSSGTWIAPAGKSMVRIQLWGGGGGGGRTSVCGNGGGGGGGGYNEIVCPISYLASSVSITVAAGGAGATSLTGFAGGNSSVPLANFPGGATTILAYGGGAGSHAYQGGGGGGPAGAGVTQTPGAPLLPSGNDVVGIYYQGSGSTTVSCVGNRTGVTGIFHGGGGGSGGGTLQAGGSIYGGGGGNHSICGGVGGKSIYGGNGGTGAGGAGVQPGGGGGTNGTTAGRGGAGRVVITSW